MCFSHAQKTTTTAAVMPRALGDPVGRVALKLDFDRLQVFDHAFTIVQM